jgi:UDP-2,4-diacetamido-2,4,6-trideoxy-beta-L-altropyranose hydrolase
MPQAEMPLLLRADANARIGSGHVMRCLALAEAWQERGGQATFLTAMKSPSLRARLESEDVRTVEVAAEPGDADDAGQAAALARELNASWVVVDGYHFGAAYQQAIKDAGLRLLFIDDNGHAEHYCCDLLLNQNAHACEGLYASREPGTRLLLGTRYSLLRREFWPWRQWRRRIAPVAGKVLVTLGGSDPDNVTLKVIRALGQTALQDVEATVLVGGDNPHYAELHAAAGESPTAIRLEQNATNVPELMAWADLAVSAGGSTCWELALMGLPSLVIVLAENQRLSSEALGARGAAVCLGWAERVSSEHLAAELCRLGRSRERRSEASRKARELVDGHGGTRVCDAMS